MPALSFAPASRLFTVAASLLAVMFFATGCAQQRSEGYYNPPVESTTTDAQYQGQGAGYRTVVHAPSQLQIELKPQQPNRPQNVAQASADNEEGVQAPDPGTTTAATNAAAAELIPQAQTYQGTLPCIRPGMDCEAQRVTLTLAPNGIWRARIAYLEGHPKAGKPEFDQGCWTPLAQERPPRIMLLDTHNNVRVDLAMPANNTLRVRSADGRTPNLNYTLTRQPDLDPIAELNQQATPKCAP